MNGFMRFLALTFGISAGTDPNEERWEKARMQAQGHEGTEARRKDEATERLSDEATEGEEGRGASTRP